MIAVCFVHDKRRRTGRVHVNPGFFHAVKELKLLLECWKQLPSPFAPADQGSATLGGAVHPRDAVFNNFFVRFKYGPPCLAAVSQKVSCQNVAAAKRTVEGLEVREGQLGVGVGKCAVVLVEAAGLQRRGQKSQRETGSRRRSPGNRTRPPPLTGGLDLVLLHGGSAIAAAWSTEGLPEDRMPLEDADIPANCDTGSANGAGPHLQLALGGRRGFGVWVREEDELLPVAAASWEGDRWGRKRCSCHLWVQAEVRTEEGEDPGPNAGPSVH
ncbi:dynein heavy chain 11, axonemal-like isoform X2 [Arapaima gigas]